MPLSEAPALPAKVSAKSVEQDIVGDRGRLVSIGMGAVFVECVVFATLRLAVSWHTGHLTPWWGNAVGAGAIAALSLWFRVDPIRRSSVGVHGTALIATVALTIPAAYGMSSSKWWLALVGFSVLLMARRREARVWAAVTAFMLPATAFVEPYIQIPNAVGESGVERAMSGLFFVVLLMGVTAGFRNVADRRAQELSDHCSTSRAGGRRQSGDPHRGRRDDHAHGADCDVAENGFDAIQAARRARYQLVLMDLKMPGLDGPGAARAILTGTGDRPRIVGVTSDLHDGVREACLSAGMIAVLKKPVRLADLAPLLEARRPK